MKNKKHTPLLAALATLVVLLAGVVLIWLAKVRPDVGKGRSEIVTDFLRAELLQDGQTATQVFTYDKDILTIGLEFYLPGDQPSGALDVVLYDADTGEELSRSVGTMDYIVPDQYTTLGMDPAVTGQEGRRYKLAVTPHYATDAILAIGHSDGVALWKEQMAVDDRVIDGTMAMQITYQRIGGYLTRFFLLVGGLAAGLAALAVWAVLSKKLALHRLVFVLVLGFGLLYSFVLPPYAAPDEKYHINQSFTLACRWANDLSHDEWRMGKVPTTTSFRRVGDEEADLQNENTTVFTWEAFTSQLFTTTDQPFDSHQEYNELQTDQNPLLYVVSAAAVFLAYVLHFGFAPALFLGRLANLLLFAALAALAVKTAPFGKRVFTVAALLPMTLHLAASFSRDAPLLGLCFVFTALLMDAAFGPNQKKALSPARLTALLFCGVLLAPGKLVYLPLAALLLLVPAARLGHHARAKKCAYLAACLALALLLNTGLLTDTLRSGQTAVQTTAAEDADRTVKSRPAEPDEAYEAEICGESTLENYVKRLYYYVDDNRSPAAREVAFWVQALQEGDVTAAVLGQSFFFSPEEVEHSSLTDDEFMSAASLVYLDRDLMTTDAEMCRERLATADRRDFFKSMFSSDECAELLSACQIYPGVEDDRYPLDRNVLIKEIEAVRTVRDSQSTPSEEDQTTFTPGYILHNLPAVAMLLVRSVVQDADSWVRGLVGGSLSYSSLDLAWFWVLALYLLLWYAAVPAQDVPVPGLPQGRYRVWCALAALLCAALAFAGCLVWTPTYYQTVYGFQGRYLLPVLPLFLLTCLPRRVQVASGKPSACTLVCCLCVVNAGVLLNAMLAVIAR